MADTLTSPFGLTLIEIGASENAWGAKINANFTAIDNLLDGTTMIYPNVQAGAWKISGTVVSATAAEINFLSGATSAIQTQLNGKQAADAALTALSAFNTNGFLAQTAVDTFAGRTLTQGAGISVTNGNGVAGDPTISATIASTDTSLAAGYTTTAVSDGAKSGAVTYTPTPAGGNMRAITNAGAFTLAAPTASGDFTMVVLITNVTGAGAITLGAFTKTAGANFTTTVGSKFVVYITKISSLTVANVVALQ